MLDYLVVGLGLASISFCEQLEKHGKSYAVISDDSQSSSLVAGGLYNPVVLKRFTLVWKAKEQLAEAIPFYTGLEKKLGVRLNHRLPVYRRFASIEEQNLWFEASDKKGLSEFLSTDIHPNKNPRIAAPFGYGEVLGTGRIDTKLLVTSYKEYLREKDAFHGVTFDYGALRIEKDGVAYEISNTETNLKVSPSSQISEHPLHPETSKISESLMGSSSSTISQATTLKARRIVFAEGFGMKKNPFFNYLPMQGSKGEYLFIKAPELQEKNAIKSSLFIIPEGNDIYRVGANYEREDKTGRPTEKAREELLKKWEAVVHCEYEVIDQVAGVRPTVSDRKPLVGRHPEHKNVYLLNGFGSRGVMTGPFVAQQLFEYTLNNRGLDKDLNIARFEDKYVKG